MSLPVGLSASSAQKTVMFVRSGFDVKTRQQPDPCDATSTNVTPRGSTLGPCVGSDPRSLADDVQERSKIDINTNGNADRRTPSMQTSLALQIHERSQLHAGA
jgi:hypothetical protein